MKKDIVSILRRGGLLEDPSIKWPTMHFEAGGSASGDPGGAPSGGGSDAGDAGGAPSGGVSGDPGGAPSGGGADNSSDTVGDSGEAATDLGEISITAPPMSSELSQLQSDLGISATEAAMMSQVTGNIGVATNGMTQSELGLLAANGLGNSAVSSTQTVNQALASMAVHGFLNNNIGQIMGAIGGPALGAIATAANAVAQGHSVASVIGQVAASVVGTALSNALGITVTADTVSAIANGQIGQAALGMAIGNIASSTGISPAAVAAALSGNLGAAVANSVTSAVVGSMASSMSVGPLGNMALGAMASLSGVPASVAASINQSEIGQAVNAATSAVSSAVASSGVGVPGGAAGIGAAVNSALSGGNVQSQSEILQSATNKGTLDKAKTITAPAPSTPSAPKKKVDYWGNLYDDLSSDFSKPPATPAVNNAETRTEARQIATNLLKAQEDYTSTLGTLTPEAALAISLSADPVKYVDSLYTSYDEARDLWTSVVGTQPTGTDLRSLTGLDENTSSAAAIQVDKNTVNKIEAEDFWEKAGFTEPPDDIEIKRLMGMDETSAEKQAIRSNAIQESTFSGDGYGSEANAKAAAEAAGYNKYSWNGKEYGVSASAETSKIEDKKYSLVDGILKSQGTDIQKASDAQLQAAMDKVNAVPTKMLGNATLQDVIKGSYSTTDADGTFRYEITGAGVMSESPQEQASKATKQLPPGLVLAKESDVWGEGGERNPNVEYMVLPDGTAAFVKRQDGQEITQLPPVIITAKRLDELAQSDPEAWLASAADFYKTHDQAGKVGGYLANTANSIVLAAYATGNEDLADAVKQTLSVVTQGVGEQVQSLTTFFTDRLGMDHNSALAKSGKVLQDWGAANQSKNTKDQEAAISAAVSKADGVGGKIAAFASAVKDNPGGFASMVAKEGVQEILPLWAAKAVYQFGTLAAVSANTAIEAIESWGSGTKETYEQAKKMGFSDEEARIMGSKVGLQSAVITTFTNGFGDNPLVKRIIGDTVKDSAVGITKAGVREGFTEYFDELGQNASKQYQLTGKVNWDQATTAATIGMGVGAGTTTGILMGVAINDAAVVGKDASGRNVTYGDFLSGAKQVDMSTLDLNAKVGTSKDGDSITLGGITAMPMASGISYDMVKSGLPSVIANQNVIVGQNELGDNVTLAQLMGNVTDKTDFDTLYKNLINTTPEQTTEAQTKFISDTLKDSGYTATADEINALISTRPPGSGTIKTAVESYVDPRQVNRQEALDYFASYGYLNPTNEEVAQFILQRPEAEVKTAVEQYVDPRQVVESEARQYFADLGYLNPTKAEVDQFIRQQGEADVQAELGQYVDPRQVTQAEATKFFADFGYTPTKQELDSYIRQGAGISQEAVKSEIQTYADPRAVDEGEAKAAYEALGLKKPTQADIQKMLGQYAESELAGKAASNLEAARYNSLIQQVEELGAKAGVDPAALEAIKNDINAQITSLGGDVAKLQSGVDSLATGVSNLDTQAKAQYDSLSAAQKATADALIAQGTTLTEAIAAAQTATSTQISGLGASVDARIQELMTQGDTYQAATQKAIGELGAQNKEMAGLIGTQGRAAGQTDVDALSQMLAGTKPVDLTYDVTGDKQITQADIDFLTQVVGGTKPDWTAPVGSAFGPTGLYGQLATSEAQRKADVQAQIDREAEAARVRAAKEAADEAARVEAARRAKISGTLAQGQQSLQSISQQLPQALKQAQEVSTPLYGTMEYFDPFGDPFANQKMKMASSTNPAEQSKMAAGGYIDDLLAGDMTVDDLLNLLR